MTPNIDDSSDSEVQLFKETILYLTPLLQEDATNINIEATTNIYDESDADFDLMLTQINVPLENSLQDILVQASGTQNLYSLTQLKLRVISRDLPLQHLAFYTPSLTELILDGSHVSSLRDLGNGLRNLKVLRVNNCKLTYLDGVFGLETIDELYAADNFITDITPCVFLNEIKTLDFRRNNVKNLRSISFLNLCEHLRNLSLEGNQELIKDPHYINQISEMLPRLEILDGKRIRKELNGAK